MNKHNLSVLLVNDDGYKCPFLYILSNYLNKKSYKLKVVAPKEEQSWKAKSITRFGTLEEAITTFNNQEVVVIPGTPADCTNIGVFYHFEKKPDLVFSGINVGTNVSTALSLSSGTLGAGIEANILGIPSIAFSIRTSGEDYLSWSKSGIINEDAIEKYKNIFNKYVDRILDIIFDSDEYKNRLPILYSVNFPQNINESTEIVFTKLSKFSYESCFVKTRHSYTHRVDIPSDFKEEGSDYSELKNSNISITKIDISKI